MWCVREALCANVGENRYVWRHVTAVQLQCVCVENESQLKICHYHHHHHHDQRGKNKTHPETTLVFKSIAVFSSIIWLLSTTTKTNAVWRNHFLLLYTVQHLLSSFCSPYSHLFILLIFHLLFLFSPSLPLSRQSQCCSISNTTE